MRVAGFTFVRNAVKYDYPVVEAIRSILPLCDLVVVAVGRSEDDTLGLIKQSLPAGKIRIVETVWDDTKRIGGRVLAEETDKALRAIPQGFDWAVYIQGDEVLHDLSIDMVCRSMEQHRKRADIDGLLFDYRHFYGSYDYVARSSRWYTHEIRVVRPRNSIYSYRDAQGFRKDDDRKLRVAPSGGLIHHYGWVKDPRTMQDKFAHSQRFWKDDQWLRKNIPAQAEYDYLGNVDLLQRFEGVHPAVMIDRIAQRNWPFDYDVTFNRTPVKDRIKQWLKQLGWDTYYHNYILVK